jgi:hypothetical protein
MLCGDLAKDIMKRCVSMVSVMCSQAYDKHTHKRLLRIIDIRTKERKNERNNEKRYDTKPKPKLEQERQIERGEGERERERASARVGRKN